MKNIFLLSFICISMCVTKNAAAQNVAVNSTGAKPDNSAMLDVQSSNKGMLIPRMTTAQRTSVASPAVGLLVFDNTTGSFWFNSAGGWVELVDNANNVWSKQSNNVYVNNNENVGVGTNSPAVKLQVEQGSDATASGGGFLQLGSQFGTNLALDNNEIQARNASGAGNLSLQASGGNLGVGTKNPEVKLQVSNGTDVGAASGGFLQLGATTQLNLAFDNNEILARNDGLSSDLYMQVNGGNIGIGTNTPMAKVEIDHGTTVNGANSGYLQLGALANPNLAFDNNEIQARNNYATSALFLQHNGGDLQIGATGTSSPTNVHINDGKLVKTETGNYNMMPLCYGHVSANGTLLSGTPNVTITKGVNVAQYYIKCAGITSTTTMIAVSNRRNDPAQVSVGYNSTGEAEVDLENFNQTNVEFSFIFYNP